MTVFTAQSRRESQVGCLRLRFPSPFFFFFGLWALVLRFYRYPLSFGILFTFDRWLCYLNHVFDSWMFLQIRGT